MLRWSGTDKGFKDNAMNPAAITFSVTAKCQEKVSLAADLWPKFYPGIAKNGHEAIRPSKCNQLPSRPHASITSGAVAGESGNIFVNDCRIGFGHDSLLQADCVRGRW